MSRPLLKTVCLRMMIPALFGYSLAASAQTTVEDAWVRATVVNQPSTGAFMRITSTTNSKLVAVKSSAAKTVQIHQSTMKDDIMSMHPVDAVPLPAGQAVEIEPGGYHVMLIGLAAQIKAGDEVPLTLVVEDEKGAQASIEIKATARGAEDAEHSSMHMH